MGLYVFFQLLSGKTRESCQTLWFFSASRIESTAKIDMLLTAIKHTAVNHENRPYVWNGGTAMIDEEID
jgi:hypothetical protein